MPRLDSTVATYRLAIEPEKCSVKQAPKHMHPNLAAKVKVERNKLQSAGFVWEVHYPI